MARNVPIGTKGGGMAKAPTQQPSVQRENKADKGNKGDVRFGVAPSGVRGTQKGCC